MTKIKLKSNAKNMNTAMIDADVYYVVCQLKRAQVFILSVKYIQEDALNKLNHYED